MTDGTTAAHEALIQLLYQAPIGLVQTTLDGEITMINPMSAQLLMPLVAEGGLDNLFTVLAPVAPQLRELAGLPSKPGDVLCEGLHVALRSAGDVGDPATTLAIRLVRLDETTLVASLSDITQSVRQQQQRMADHWRDATRIDNLTALPNRAVVLERIDVALRTAHDDPACQFAVLFINIDRFDRINVTLGQPAGDELLRLVAGRLNIAVRTRDAVGRASPADSGQDGSSGAEVMQPPTPSEHTAARLGGDEFVVLLEGLRSADDASLVAQRLCDALRKPYGLGGQPVHSSASIGVVLRAHSQGDADTLLQDARLAMREAKRVGGACFRVFDPVLKERAWRRGNLEADLRQALAAEQLFVVYQPIVDMAQGGVSGMEALVRWRHPKRGTVPPVEFIEIAEECGLIGALGEFVLNQACLQSVAWQRTLGDQAPRVMSVNVSRAQLSDTSIAAVGQWVRGAGVELYPFGSTGFCHHGKTEGVKQRPDLYGNPTAFLHAGARSRIEVEHHPVRHQRVVGHAMQRHMQLQCRQVGHPHQCGHLIHDAIGDVTLRHSIHPLRRM